VFWHAKGWTMFQELRAYMARRIRLDYEEVNAPQVLDKSLWETSGHWGWYQENMFAVKSAHAFTHPDDKEADQKVFALKPMNCPGHVQIFKHGLKSYRDLPIRIAEFGIVHRYEASGALHGLMRVRGFTQDDAHVFCTEEQLEAEIMKINDLMMSVYRDFGFTEVVVKLATRPEKRVGTDAMWDHAEAILRKALERMASESGGAIKTGINEGEGTFYGPKFEYTLRDAIGRDWQCGTTQVDFNLPERFGAFYIGADGEKKQPVMVHRAVVGSLERFLGIIIESYGGNFPLWLAPVQIVVAPITSEVDGYAEAVTNRLLAAGLRARADLRNEKINYKVREHSLAKVPIILAVGKREAEEKTVSVRRLGSQAQTTMAFAQALESFLAEATPPDVKRAQAALDAA
jgi:threonyl-tRNA synthetase